MKEKAAISAGIIPAAHPYPTDGTDVIFKKDVLVNSGANVPEGEYEALTTPQALKKYDEWQ